MDFENYSVGTERAEAIRTQLREIREKAQVGQLELLVTELGTDESEEAPTPGTTQPALPGFGNKDLRSQVKSYKTSFAETLAVDDATAVPTTETTESSTTPSTVQHQVEIRSTDAEIRLLVNGRPLIDFTSLPKADEFLINRVDETRLALLPLLFDALAEEVKKAKARKSERQAAWKARFHKET